MKELNEYQVQGIIGAKVTEFHEDGVSYVLENGTEGRVEQVDTVVLAMGYRSYDPLSQEIGVFAKEVFVIGDAVRARRAMDATKKAFETGNSNDDLGKKGELLWILMEEQDYVYLAFDVDLDKT